MRCGGGGRQHPLRVLQGVRARVHGDIVMSALLTARQVADLLGVSCETVLRWTRRGDLPAIRLPGGALRYRQEDLEAWLLRRDTSTDTLSVTFPVTQRGTT